MDECCPNCQAIWTTEEVDVWSCYACGYPFHDEEDCDREDEHDDQA